MKVDITDHALDRWQHRAAEYANAGRDDLQKAFAESREATSGDLGSLARKANSRYFFHQKSGAVFVAEPLGIDSVRLVTVVVPGQEDTVIPATKKRAKVRPVAAAAPNGSLSNAMLAALPVTTEPAHANAAAEYRWLVETVKEIEHQLSLCDNPYKKPLQNCLRHMLRKYSKRKTKIKDAAKACEAAERLANATAVFDSGGLNYTAAILYLLERVGTMQLQLIEAYERIATLEEKQDGCRKL